MTEQADDIEVLDGTLAWLQSGATRMGLPCGGRLEVLVEQLTDPDSIKQLLERLGNGELVARTVDLSCGETNLHPGDGGTEFHVSETALIKTFGPAWQLLLIGDGQLARHLASMALHLDYRVIICDPRDDFAHPAPLPDVYYSRKMPDDVIQGLSAALESQAFYIGALGSTRSAEIAVSILAQITSIRNGISRPAQQNT